jgi:hypothetical protein
MKARSIHWVLIAASVFASFVICLCISVAEIMPLIIFVILTAAVAAAYEGRIIRPYTAVKLFTQKAE